MQQIQSNKQHHLVPNLLLMGFGGLSALAFAPYHQIWILFITFGFLMAILNRLEKRSVLFWRSFSFGFGLGVFSMAWICNALMIDSGSFAWLIPIALIGLGSFFGLCFAIPAVVAGFVSSGVCRWLMFGAVFTLVEWLRSWLILGGFPWNLLGNVWTGFLPVLQSVSVIGVYGLTLFSILLFTVLPLWKINRRVVLSVSATFILLALLGVMRLYTTDIPNVWGVRLRLVQPNIAQTLKWNPQEYENNFTKLIHLSRDNNEKITHIIWPESAVPFIMNENEYERTRIMSALPQGAFLLTGGLRRIPETKELANSFFILNDLTDIIVSYDKFHLVPFGEYAPLRGILPIDKIVPFENDFYRGKGPQTLSVPKAPSLSPLICYEVIFPNAVVNRGKRPNWIVNITNDAWFGISAGPYQHYDAAVVRAVEEGLPVARVGNHGVSGVINPLGESSCQLALGVEGVSDCDLPSALPKTLFSQFGYWFWMVFVGVIFLFCLKRRK